MMPRCWRDHSLSIVLFGIGATLTLGVIPLREGTAFDLLSGIGTAFLTGGIINLLSGPLRERNRPEA